MSDDDEKTAEPLPDYVADAWAAVLIDIHEKRRGEREEEDEPCRDEAS